MDRAMTWDSAGGLRAPMGTTSRRLCAPYQVESTVSRLLFVPKPKNPALRAQVD